jgi:hypothetical protein
VLICITVDLILCSNTILKVWGVFMKKAVLFILALLLPISLYSQYLITDQDSLLNNSADYLIITHQDFTEKLNPLCKLRDSLGLTVKMVESDLIYSTFPDNTEPLMIKKFTQQVYDQWDKRPQFIGRFNIPCK